MTNRDIEKYLTLCQAYDRLGPTGKTVLQKVLSDRDVDFHDYHPAMLNNIMLFLNSLSLLMCDHDRDVASLVQLIVDIFNHLKENYQEPYSYWAK